MVYLEVGLGQKREFFILHCRAEAEEVGEYLEGCGTIEWYSIYSNFNKWDIEEFLTEKWGLR